MPETRYFPLIAGLELEYQISAAEGIGTLKFQVLSLETSGSITVAQCRRTSAWNGKAETSGATVTVADNGVFSGKYREFPLPLAVGDGWDADPRRYEVESLSEEVSLPAGAFKGCLKVSYLIAGGDGGSGARYYAPGVGFVLESCNDEVGPFEKKLTRFSIPK